MRFILDPRSHYSRFRQFHDILNGHIELHGKGQYVASQPTAEKDKSLESWIWDAACSIRGAKDAPKYENFTLLHQLMTVKARLHALVLPELETVGKG